MLTKVLTPEDHDHERTLVSVMFTREGDEFTLKDEVEVLYEAHVRTNGVNVNYGLEMKSATLMTDREKVRLTRQEAYDAFHAACDALEAHDPDW
jgi:hypothetical protein